MSYDKLQNNELSVLKLSHSGKHIYSFISDCNWRLLPFRKCLPYRKCLHNKYDKLIKKNSIPLLFYIPLQGCGKPGYYPRLHPGPGVDPSSAHKHTYAYIVTYTLWAI